MYKPKSKRFPHTAIGVAYSNHDLRRRHRPEEVESPNALALAGQDER
jgi:hypothetical protein